MIRLLLCLVIALAAEAQQAERMAVEATQPGVLWRAPNDIGMENWRCGSAGCDHAPAPPYHFVKEDMEGTFPKLSIQDAKGRAWSVKFGGKVIPESFSSRFVAALGYVVEPSYYVGSGKLDEVSQLRRARNMVKPDGTFHHARFQLRDNQSLQFLKDHSWSLADNPFRGSHEFAGLRVAMMLLSNWDAKDARDGQQQANTAVFRGPAGEMLYSFFDWGSTLGRWGKLMRRTRSDCAGFAEDSPALITGVRENVVEWGYSGKHEDDVRSGITVEDLRWLAPYLSRITDEQIRTGLTASGATPRQTTCWAEGLESRIHAVLAVAQNGQYAR
ncbi:MAG TPA: hypothetical protein VKB88_36540 [Bryobacteraceae bacterium]|nr:hypothetical protein [Bryobacteraceae bacterium]